MQDSILTTVVKDIDGEVTTLEKYAGNVLLIVNVASKCGLTPQYEQLENIQKAWVDRGFMVLGFPCNQLLEQEPGSDEEIKTRIEESCKGYDEAMATLAECQRKLREGGPLVREGAEKARQEALRFREEARKKNR